MEPQLKLAKEVNSEWEAKIEEADSEWRRKVGEQVGEAPERIDHQPRFGGVFRLRRPFP